MSSERYRCLLISDFTIDNLAGFLSNDGELPVVDAFTAPFNSVMRVLLDRGQKCWRSEYDFAVVWTRPEGVIQSFNSVLNYRPVDIERLLSEVDDYSSALSTLSDRARFAFVPSWVVPGYRRGFGMLEMKPSVGITAVLMQMNMRLTKYFENSSSLYVMDTRDGSRRLGEGPLIRSHGTWQKSHLAMTCFWREYDVQSLVKPN